MKFTIGFSINAFKTALAASYLAIAACGGSGSGDAQSASSSAAISRSIRDTSAPNTVSLSGTAIPNAVEIIDNAGAVWTVTGGVIYENGALAGYSSAVTQLLYDNNTIFQENAAGGWWSWNGATWVASSNPTAVPSPDGTSLPTATQITDGNGNIWVVVGGVIYENGALAGYSNAVTQLFYGNAIISQENAAGNWWSWNGGTWVSSSNPTDPVSSPNGTSLPTATQITDTSGNVWTMVAGVVYENGALAGYSSGVTQLVFNNKSIFQENAAGGWWSWNGSTWVSSGNPNGNSNGNTTGSASLSWATPTQNTDGTPLTNLAGYTIYYGTSPATLTQTVQLTDPSAISYVVSNLSASTTYYFTVAGYSATGMAGAAASMVSKIIN